MKTFEDLMKEHKELEEAMITGIQYLSKTLNYQDGVRYNSLRDIILEKGVNWDEKTESIESQLSCELNEHHYSILGNVIKRKQQIDRLLKKKVILKED